MGKIGLLEFIDVETIGLAVGVVDDVEVVCEFRDSWIAFAGGKSVSSRHPAGIHLGASSGAVDGTPVPSTSR